MDPTTPVFPDYADRDLPDEQAAGHEALAVLARELLAAADSGNPQRFAVDTHRFLAELIAHLRGESHDLSSLSGGRRRELARGQQELVRMATALAEADPHSPGVSRTRPARVLVGALQAQRFEEQRAMREGPWRGKGEHTADML